MVQWVCNRGKALKQLDSQGFWPVRFLLWHVHVFLSHRLVGPRYRHGTIIEKIEADLFVEF